MVGKFIWTSIFDFNMDVLN
jgi:hypothetical protein